MNRSRPWGIPGLGETLRCRQDSARESLTGAGTLNLQALPGFLPGAAPVAQLARATDF